MRPKSPQRNKFLISTNQSVGGAQRIAGLTSLAAKGTIEGFDTYHVLFRLSYTQNRPTNAR